jgi:ethanolamine kinase
MSYRSFDIANHFCEFAGFDCDWTKLPTISQQRNWLAHYTETQYVETVLGEVQTFIPAAHFFWAVWALVQAEISELEFDYLGYAKMRLDQYFITRSAASCN